MALERIGKKDVFHCTNKQAGACIWREAKMVAGRQGMFGAAIDFADTEDAARHKARYDGSGDDVVITASVDFGTSLVLQAPDPAMTAERLHSRGGDSVKGRSSPQADWEYVVFDPSRITFRSFKGEFPFIASQPGPPSRVTSWVADIRVACASTRISAVAQVPKGYQLLQQDLCQGTKQSGDYVFLSYKRTQNIGGAVTHIVLEHFENRQTISEYVAADGKRYKRILTDLNSHARGRFVYISFTKDRFTGVPPVSGISAYYNEKPQPPRNWEYVCWNGTNQPADTNKGAGGAFIWLYMLKE
jgi:hypothetical protein